MRYRLHDIPALMSNPLGRIQVRSSIYVTLWPVLSRLASLYRRSAVRGTRIVAVVGSFGKSTTTNAVVAALGEIPYLDAQSSSSSYLAGGIFRIRPGDRHAVFEVGISGIGEMAPYARMIRPDIAVVTSIGSEHHTSLGTLETTRREKAAMVRILPLPALRS